ncbi:MAG: cell division protein ZapA [Bacteroidetes bacterium]|nr:MAG: cell division protein ZapA [Bacteroidota bacterium]
MEDQDSKRITITIAGRPYPLKIKASDEAVIRKIAREVNEKINRFQLSYPNRDKQDCLALALLAYAVDLYKANLRSDAHSSKELSEKLSGINDLLDQVLQ